MNSKIALAGLATVAFAVGYGLLMAEIFVSGVDGWGELAGAIMGGAVLVLMAVGVWGMIELQRFLGK